MDTAKALLVLLSLFITRVWSQTITISPVPLEAVENENLTLFCEAASGGGSLIIRMNDVTSPMRSSRISSNTTHAEYLFGPIRRSDNDGNFTCSAAELNSNVATLTVLYTDDFIFENNSNLVNSTLTLPEGSGTTVSFSIVTNPGSVSTLTREDGGIRSNRIVLQESRVEISNVQRSDAGIYVLTAISRGQSPSVMASSTATIDLVVEYSPTLTVASMDSDCVSTVNAATCSVMLEANITIDCIAEAVPEAVVMIGGTESMNVAVEGASITITGVTEENLRTYQCSATNVVGGQRRTATIDIILARIGGTNSESPTITTNSTSCISPSLLSFVALVLLALYSL